MTDEEINRAVALARGWTEENRVGYTLSAIGTYMVWLDRDGREVDKRLFFVSSSPAAWGALLNRLKEEGSVSLSYLGERGLWFATVTREPAIYTGWDADKPGRAIAEAFLRSKGVL